MGSDLFVGLGTDFVGGFNYRFDRFFMFSFEFLSWRIKLVPLFVSFLESFFFSIVLFGGSSHVSYRALACHEAVFPWPVQFPVWQVRDR